MKDERIRPVITARMSASAARNLACEHVRAPLVHFLDGAVTFWHTHPGGQQLFVVRGEARVGTEADGEVRLGTGTLVVCPPHERHWHGAAPGNDATLLAVTWGTTQWETEAPE